MKIVLSTILNLLFVKQGQTRVPMRILRNVARYFGFAV